MLYIFLPYVHDANILVTSVGHAGGAQSCVTFGTHAGVSLRAVPVGGSTSMNRANPARPCVTSPLLARPTASLADERLAVRVTGGRNWEWARGAAWSREGRGRTTLLPPSGNIHHDLPSDLGPRVSEAAERVLRRDGRACLTGAGVGRRGCTESARWGGRLVSGEVVCDG